MRMHTYAGGLRAAAVYAQDYLHAADVQQLQRVLYRFAAIAECDECTQQSGADARRTEVLWCNFEPADHLFAEGC